MQKRYGLNKEKIMNRRTIGLALSAIGAMFSGSFGGVSNPEIHETLPKMRKSKTGKQSSGFKKVDRTSKRKKSLRSRSNRRK